MLSHRACLQQCPEVTGGIDGMILTQRDPGSAGVGVDPEGQPGENDDEQRRGVNTHHVEANLSPQGEDDLHTCVVACVRDETTVSHRAGGTFQHQVFRLDFFLTLH